METSYTNSSYTVIANLKDLPNEFGEKPGEMELLKNSAPTRFRKITPSENRTGYTYYGRKGYSSTHLVSMRKRVNDKGHIVWKDASPILISEKEKKYEAVPYHDFPV